VRWMTWRAISGRPEAPDRHEVEGVEDPSVRELMYDELLPFATQERFTYMQGLTLVPISAQLELFCPPCKPTSPMNVSWSCSS